MYSLNQEKPWYLSDEWYVTVEEFDAIRRMNFPKDFIDFFEIAFRTGLHEKDILNLKKENITLVKDENNNIVSGRIYGNSIKFKTPINVKLDQKSLSILTNRMESTKIEFLFVNELNHLTLFYISKNIFIKHSSNYIQTKRCVNTCIQFEQETLNFWRVIM